MTFEFFLGVHRPNWLDGATVPLFVSHATLHKLRHKFPRAAARWALDSGGFTEVSERAAYRWSPADYAASAARYQREIGTLAFASIQDWMCEPPVLKRTGLTVAEHQTRTIDSFLELSSRAPEVPWLPVVQGWGHGEYLDHVEAYARRGVDLTRAPRVGVGSICRRQASISAALILGGLQSYGLRLHAFGLKAKGLDLALEYVSSADSLAWSSHARSEHRSAQKWLPAEQRTKTGEQNSLAFALEWRADVIGRRVDLTVAA